MIKTVKIAQPVPGVNEVTMGKPEVKTAGEWKFVKVPFYTPGAEWPREATWFVPKQGTQYSTLEEQQTRMAAELIDVYSLFIPEEELVGNEYNSFEELINDFNSKLPADFTQVPLEVVMCYGKPNKGKSYLEVANRKNKNLAGKRWLRRKDSDTAPLTWNEEFEKELIAQTVPTKKIVKDDELDI